jgi:DNA polymerase III subunit alpha
VKGEFLSVFNKIISPDRFVGLHAHSGVGSPYDGLGYPSQHIDFVLGNGMNSWALTDHGNGNGLAHAHTHAKNLKKMGRKYRQIYGVEFYFVPSLSAWKDQYSLHRKEQELLKKAKTDTDDISGGLIIEDESDTKSKVYAEWKKRYHLIVLAKSKKGLENLFTLVKRSYAEGFYRFPRIDFEMLQQHREGLIVSTACIGGYPSGLIYDKFPDVEFSNLKPSLLDDKSIMSSVTSDIENMVDRFSNAVGVDNFFLELQFNKLNAQHLTNRALIEVSKTTGIPLVATADSHYPGPEMWEARELYKKLGRMGARGSEMQELPKFEDLKCELYPKNASQMWDTFKESHDSNKFYSGNECLVRDAIERSYDIAWDMCNEVWFDESAKLPNFNTNTETAFSQLVSRIKAALVSEGLHNNKEYVDRAHQELEVIKKLGFENYFLTMVKVFDLASKGTLIGPGRGSGAGSLVNYLLGITTTDPIKYGLLFERFLHMAKSGWPDIDTDAGDRDVLIDASRELFGEDAVVPVSNFNTLKLKSLIKDVAKFYNIDFGEVNQMTNKLENDVMHKAMGDHEEKSTYVLTHDDCMKYSSEYVLFMTKYPKVSENVQKLFMESRSIGRHAGGVLICPDLEKHMPVIKVRGELQTPWSEGMNFRHLEPNGFLKFDFLGLTTLKMVEDCIRIVLKNQGDENPSFDNINKFFNENINCRYNDLNDKNVWKHVYHKGRFVQVFQFTQQGARKFCMQAKPNSIEELATITAIYRPGPLAAGVHRKYVKTKKMVESGNPIEYDHPVIESILKETFSFISFQEQFMLLAQKLAGFDKGASDKMRKTLVKKSLDSNDAKVQERIDLRQKFVDGSVSNSGIDRDKAEKLYETIEYFSGYGFNKSHAVSYAIDSYYSAWLHTHYEKEWLATCLGAVDWNPKKLSKVMSEIKQLGYNILEVDINTSIDTWSYNEQKNGFAPPLSAIKGVGSAAVEEIMTNRKQGIYETLHDLLFDSDGVWRHSKMNKRCFQSLCKIEAFGSLHEMKTGEIDNHNQLLSIIIDNYDVLRKGKFGMSFRKAKKIDAPEILPILIERTDGLPDWSRSQKIEQNVELTSGASGDLVFPEDVINKIKNADVPPLSSLSGKQKGVVWFCIQESIKKTTKNNKTFWRIKTIDTDYNIAWLRVWGELDNEPEPYTLWLAEVASSEAWGCSTSGWKMKQIGID